MEGSKAMRATKLKWEYINSSYTFETASSGIILPIDIPKTTVSYAALPPVNNCRCTIPPSKQDAQQHKEALFDESNARYALDRAKTLAKGLQ